MEARPRPRKRSRDVGFDPILAGECHAQQATDRFGDIAKTVVRDRELAEMGHEVEGDEIPVTWPAEDWDQDAENERSPYKIIPSMQSYRNNLTALSQVHNVGLQPFSEKNEADQYLQLYFVAYTCRIFVYRPRGALTNRLPKLPDMQLIPKRTRTGRYIMSDLSPGRPHTINHLITGFLGREEILLACFDDGDVVAYYVKDIAARVFKSQDQSCVLLREAPKPILNDNVGKSAWGLAIHSKSRLIAVSSNRHEVTVFAFALSKARPRSVVESIGCPHDWPDEIILSRSRSWRILVSFGMSCSNIPNINFIDDLRGNAEKICAIDIYGSVWIADIWKPYQGSIRIRSARKEFIKSETEDQKSRGWGICVLPHWSFMTVNNSEHLFGVSQEGYQEIVGMRAKGRVNKITAIIRPGPDDIPGNPCPPYRSVKTSHGEVRWVSPETSASPTSIDSSENSSEDEWLETTDEWVAPAPAQWPSTLVMQWPVATVEEEDTAEWPAMLVEWSSGSYTVSQPVAEAESLAQSPPPPEAYFEPESPDDPDDTELSMEAEALTKVQNILGGNNALIPTCLKKLDGKGLIMGLTLAEQSDEKTEFPASMFKDLMYTPHNGNIIEIPKHPLDKARILAGKLQHNNNKPDAKDLEKLASRIYLLRAYEKDLELIGLRPTLASGVREVDTLIQDVATMRDMLEAEGRSRLTMELFYATSRLSMIAHMTELSAVAIASPTGRVLLVTLTRLATPEEHSEYVVKHAFRVDLILPTAEDEMKFRRTCRPLFGMAAAPVLQPEGDWRGRPDLPVRYRLMLHYRNHDILSYEISREGQMGKLCLY